MVRGSTPKHTFTLPIPTSTVKKVRITYEQLGREILEKTEDDVKMEENTITLRLTQSETLKFKENKDARIQLKVLTNSGDLLPSQIFTVTVKEILDEEELI